ncbi:MAG: hypothetical protein PUH55_01530 [Spirochaetales bacterium]|nr:hypothetical protein [Spirochaetales bacterium]
MSTFSLYCRDGIWYAHVNIREGVRKRISLKTKSKKQAMEKALEMQAEGAWEPSGDGSWWSYARDWWIWDKCPYVKESVRNGRRLTRGYVDMCRTEMLKYIDPAFHDRPLKEITSGEIPISPTLSRNRLPGTRRWR